MAWGRGQRSTRIPRSDFFRCHFPSEMSAFTDFTGCSYNFSLVLYVPDPKRLINETASSQIIERNCILNFV